jgi:hypothetical protein
MLHVTNGDSAVAKLRATGLEGTLLPWRDVLHEGPVPGDVGDVGLRDVRARFLAGQGWAAEEDVRADMRHRDQRLDRAIADGEEIMLWFESDLYDMLQLAQILDRLPEEAATLVIVGEERFVGVAELEPHELRALAADGAAHRRGRRIPVDAAVRHAGRALWTALRAPEPTQAVRLAEQGTPALPALGEAARRLLEQLPWHDTGVNRTERALLEAVAGGARAREAAFLAQQRQEERPFMGDATAFAYHAALADGQAALLRNHGPLLLTPSGEAVLAGGARWEGRPERWLGGLLVPGGSARPPWAWDPAAGRVV